jgi:hypothetical protein
MTPRERVLSVLRQEKPDQVPWFGDLDYWATALIERGQKPSDFKQSATYIDWHRELGVGFYLQGQFPFKTTIENCDIREWHEGARRLREIRTPEGTLRECWTYMPASFTEGPTEYLVKNEGDLPAYRYLYENTQYEPDYTFTQLRQSQIGDMGILLCYLPKSPLMQMIALDAGIMAVTTANMNAPAELAHTVAVIRKKHEQGARIALESPAQVLMIPENLSSEVLGLTFFEKYVRSYHQEWATRIRLVGKYACIHLDGTLKGLLRQECALGLSFIEAMTPAPVGDLAIEEWPAWRGDSDTVFWGGIPGVYFTDLVDDAEFDRHVKQVLAVMRTEPRYVLGVADQVPPDGLVRRVKRVRELVDTYARYE